MKLTNLQLEVVSGAISDIVETKKAEIKGTPAFTEKVEELIVAQGTETKLDLATQYAVLEKEIKEKEDAQKILLTQYKTIPGTYQYNRAIPKPEAIVKEVEDLALTELTKDLPTGKQIRASIVLEALSGGVDLLESIKAKFNL